MRPTAIPLLFGKGREVFCCELTFICATNKKQYTIYNIPLSAKYEEILAAYKILKQHFEDSVLVRPGLKYPGALVKMKGSETSY